MEPHEYKPIGTGECWTCGEPFYKHWNGFFCVGCEKDKAEIDFPPNVEFPGICAQCNELLIKP